MLDKNSFNKGIDRAIEAVEEMKELREIENRVEDGIILQEFERGSGLLRKEDVINKLKRWRQ